MNIDPAIVRRSRRARYGNYGEKLVLRRKSCYDLLRNAKVCKTREKTQTLAIPVLLRNSARGEFTLRDREVGGSNPLAPT